jgi:hypothetical protein
MWCGFLGCNFFLLRGGELEDAQKEENDGVGHHAVDHDIFSRGRIEKGKRGGEVEDDLAVVGEIRALVS